MFNQSEISRISNLPQTIIPALYLMAMLWSGCKSFDQNLAESASIEADLPCRTIEISELSSRLRQSKTRLVFFASWCKSCKDHLLAETGEPTLRLGTFDSEENIAAIARRFHHLQPECLIAGEAILAEFNVQSLPFVVSIQF